MSQNNLVNIRAIRNKKSIKSQKLDAVNAHDKFYDVSDDSDDERILSRIGRLQTKKYADKDFIGYDENLQKIKKKAAHTDKIEEFIAKSENKDWWRIVRDELNNQDVKLSDAQLNLLDRIRTGKQAQSFNYTDYIFEHDDFDNFNLLSSYNPKRRFVESKWERIKINKLVQGIKLGRIKLRDDPKEVQKLYDAWMDEQEPELNKYLPPRIQAAKAALPQNIASYNPPEEYLFTKEEKEQWMQQHEEDREIPFIPQKFKYLRNVPSTDLLTRELFSRCLDLYLAPRIRRKKMQMQSSDFLPEIPKPEELKPFPSHLNLEFGQVDVEAAGGVVGLSITYDGSLLIACYVKCVVFFDTRSTKCLYTQWLDGDKEFFGLDVSHSGIVGIVHTDGITIINTHIDKREIPQIEVGKAHSIVQEPFVWTYPSNDAVFQTLLDIQLPYDPTHIQFHPKSDYFVTTQPRATQKSHSILVHCLSKATSSQPFQNMKATTEVKQTLFHPTQPQLIIMTSKNIFLYALNTQSLVKKLRSGNQWNSTLALHPHGEHILLGSQDKNVCWFDLDYGTTPLKKMAYHEKGVKRVIFHPKYPLFASCSDDGTINIFHAKVTTSLNETPLILPLKVLKLGKRTDENAVMDIAFHPSQPWIYSSTAGGHVYLWT